MTKEQLRHWLRGQKLGWVIITCPRCHKVDINPKTHLEECEPEETSNGY